VFAERLDCGVFSAAVGTHANHPFSQSSRPHESAAQAGAVQTLCDFASGFQFENTPQDTASISEKSPR
jgi:hypothetical protein